MFSGINSSILASCKLFSNTLKNQVISSASTFDLELLILNAYLADILFIFIKPTHQTSPDMLSSQRETPAIEFNKSFAINLISTSPNGTTLSATVSANSSIAFSCSADSNVGLPADFTPF